jgi:hypothetical protein
MSERADAAQDILPADDPACAELHCPPPRLTPEEQRLASKLMADPEAYKAALAELRHGDEEQGDLVEPECAPDEVPSLLIVDDLEHILRKYVILPPASYLIIALWAIGTYFTHCYLT